MINSLYYMASNERLKMNNWWKIMRKREVWHNFGIYQGKYCTWGKIIIQSD